MRKSNRSRGHRTNRRLSGLITLLLLAVLPPVGVVLLWRRNWRTSTKAALTAAAAAVQAAPPKKAAGSRGNRAQQAAKKQLTICETAIARLEADIARLDGEMAQHACDAEKLNELYRQQQDVQKRLEQEMERWEQLSLQAEEQENEA